MKQYLKIAWVILFLLIIILYGRSVNYEYNLDDYLIIENNELIQDGLSTAPKLFSSNYIIEDKASYGYRPMAKLVIGVEHLLFGKNPKAHHAINILLYLLIIALLTYLLFQIFPNHPLAIFITIWLFALHPLHTEVICSIKNRDEILSLLFPIIGLICLIQPVLREKGIHWFIVSLILLLLGMMSKVNAIAFIPIYAFFILMHWGWKKTLPYGILYGVFAMAYLLFLFFGLPSYTRESVLIEIPYLHTESLLQILNAKLYAIGTYLYKLIFPLKLFTYYGLGEIPVDSSFHFRTLFAVLFFIGIGGIGFWAWRKKNLFIAFAAVWLISTFILPSNLIVTVQGVITDRAMFAPSVAMCMLMAWLISYSLKFRGYQKYLGIIAFLIFTSFYVYKSWDRVAAWEDRYTLFSNDIKQGVKSPKVYFLYGDYCLFQYQNHTKDPKDLELAKKNLLKATQLYPTYPSANNKYGFILSRYEKKPQIGLTYLKKAVQSNPNYEDAHFNLAATYHSLGDKPNAITHYKKALQLNPNRSKARENLQILQNSD